MNKGNNLTREELERRDAVDPLASMRELFVLPEKIIYLDGNSLGALPIAAGRAVGETVEREWGQDLITSWNRHGWIALGEDNARLLAPLIGASEDEVAICDSTSVNLFKLISAATRLRPDRRIILSDATNFPTDLYVAQGIAGFLGLEFRQLDHPGQYEAALDEDVALVMLSHVDFRSGLLHDIAELARRCHATGALILVDLAHSAGALPVQLDAMNIDMAVGCGYKYLNGGPGAPAFLYLARHHIAEAVQPLSGWFGHASPFEFGTDFVPAAGISKFLVGTPPVLGMRALRTGLDVASRAPIEQVRRKSMELTQVFLDLFEQRLGRFGFTLASPREAGRRGSQVSFAHESGYAIMQAIIEAGVIGDFRAPDIVRFGMAPLYLRHVDMLDAVERIERVMADGRWREARFQQRSRVT
ncbi:MAG: kynureninase [Geminicoccaceae bacterium]|nr:kynureninase [Geminicoccaceae bacterium]